VPGGAEERALFRYPSLCPFCGTAPGRLPEWPKGAVCKTVGSAYVGSNPTPATNEDAQLRDAPASLCHLGSIQLDASSGRQLPSVVGYTWDDLGLLDGG
jgi:hypothetical protein